MAEQEENRDEQKNDLAQREEDVLAFWNDNRIFEKTLKKDAPKGDFVFYDGPPFATGLPHYGHILAGTIKDVIPRYRTMQGYRVPRRWGWDCHGLPLENQIEEKLGIKTKREIEELGVEKFNQAAKDAVLEYADDWKRIIPRMGRFVDMEDDYKTMDATYTESVWWAFAELDRKGLVYEGFKSMHLCPRCGTTLSNFEVNLGYKDIKDVAVTVKMELKDEPGTYLLAWTTTPWTLPGNFALAVHRDYDYVRAEVLTDGGSERVILAKSRIGMLPEGARIIGELKGADLVGASYAPPFAYFKGTEVKGKENAWKVYHADFVTLEDGTGIVHIAPAYGEDDMNLGKEHGLPIAHHVSPDGAFLDLVTDFAGMPVKPKDNKDTGVLHLDTDIAVIRTLAERGLLFKKENITHSYPHCWRCDTPLLNYATTSWFVEVTKMRDELVAANQKIHWVPAHVGESRFGKWLENARDWAVSRQRYWGAPIPVWKHPETGERTVIGSLADLQAKIKRSGNRYFLMRHGESENNVTGTLNADTAKSYGLTEAGKAKARATALELKAKGITRIIASPLLRTQETAEIVAAALGPDVVVETDERLREVSFGAMEGKHVDEYHDFFGSIADRFWRAPEGGETWQEAKRRMGDVLYELERTYADEKILIISHNGPLWMLMLAARGYTKDEAHTVGDRDHGVLDPGEVTELEFVPLPHNHEYELDYHRPYIDEVTLVAEDGAELVRVPDVFDCWFESGSMPYGQRHYPFENKDVFDPIGGFFKRARGYPADFISESVDQTRGWFYSLLVLGVALFGRAPYQNVITNGLVLAEDGKKMSKRLKNYPDPLEVVEKYGADTLRFYLLSSPLIRGEDLNFTEKHVAELARKNIGRLHNVLAFYELYRDAEATEVRTPEAGHVLDDWILARLAELAAEVGAGYEAYELDRATRPITDFIDDLSTWYVRRSRDRFKGADAADRGRALRTTRYVLRELSKLMAPVMPFYAEYLYGRVRASDDPESVHLDRWPSISEAFRSSDRVADMRAVRDIVSGGLLARSQANIKVRQPLARLSVRDDHAVLGNPDLVALIADEVNVKEVTVNTELASAVELDTAITEDLRREGDIRELLRAVQDLRKEHDLAPQDAIALSVGTDPTGEALVRDFASLLESAANVTSLSFDAPEGAIVSVGDRQFTLAISKN